MNYYSFHIGDYAKRTRYLTIFQDLAYRRLLDEYYITETHLKGTPEQLAGVIGMADHVGAVVAVLEQFFQKTSDGWCNDRCEEEICRLQKSAETARENGRKSAGRPKKPRDNPAGSKLDTQPVPTLVPSGMPPAPPAGTGLPTTQYPIPITHPSVPDGTGELTPPPAPPGPPDDPPEQVEPTAKDAIWSEGVAYLMSQKIPEKGARSFIGKMFAQANDNTELLRIVRACVAERSGDPQAFIKAAVDHSVGARLDRNGQRAVGKLPPRSAYRDNPDDRGNLDVPF